MVIRFEFMLLLCCMKVDLLYIFLGNIKEMLIIENS
jgi:hypothetical protein